ncbi:hypothetical protein BGZ94_001301 [Podila epigama]|nr:hypothetical protein BGZ94_001301 [Podila epigama]
MRQQSHAPRKVIAVDLDEVLAKTTLAIADFHNDTYGTSLTMDDFISYDYTKIWGGTRAESIAKWRLFFDSPYFLKVEPVEGSLETLKLLKSRLFSLVIVTARQQFVADLTKKFVDRHYPGIFESIYFANHFLTEEEKLTFISKPKSVICRDVHAQLLIDDSLENATEVANAGIPVLLFDLNGSYKWNKLEEGQTLPDKVTRVKSWKEIQDWFPRPRSPLSSQCISRDDPEFNVSDDEEEEDEDEEEEEEDEEDDEEQGQADSDSDQEYSQQPLYYQQGHYDHPHHMNDMDSDSDNGAALDDEDEEDMAEGSKRESNGQDLEEEEQDHHQTQRTLRRRKLMMMDFSSSEDDDDFDAEYMNGAVHGGHSGETNMDSDDQDFDLESGHGSRRQYAYQNQFHFQQQVSHEELERYRHQHETMYTEDTEAGEVLTTEAVVAQTQQDEMEVEMDEEHQVGEVASSMTVSDHTTTASTSTTTTTTTTIHATHIDAASNFSAVSSSDCQSTSFIATIPSATTLSDAMAVEGLSIKSPPPSDAPASFAGEAAAITTDKNMDMEEVPLS